MPKRCQDDNCNIRPIFGIELGKATHCKLHKHDNMFDVINKRCQYDDCNKHPIFGIELGKATHCKLHKHDNMFNVVSKRCQYGECAKQPFFGIESGKATHCKLHKHDNMFDVINKRCQYDICNKQPRFGVESGKATHCKLHKHDNMFNIISKRCQYDDCNKHPVFGIELGKATHCKLHKHDNMFNVVSKRCQYDECNKQPVFGIELGKATHCKLHKHDNMFDVINKLCETCLSINMNPKYKPNCARCHFALNPTDPRIRNYKTKEHTFIVPLQQEYPQLVHDKSVVGGCSRRRPDGLIDCLTHSLIIEIDENQHVGYESICNNRRMMELFTDLGNRSIVFIRLNPDGYLDSNGKRIKSIFSTSKKTGELQMNKKAFANRYAELLEHIKYHLTEIPSKHITIDELFYDAN